MSTFRRGVTRNHVVIAGVVFLLVAGAVWVLLPKDQQRLLPTDESSWVFFKCADCGAVFHLDGRELDAAVRSGELGGGRRIEARGVACRKCGSRNTEELPDEGNSDTASRP